MARQPRQETMDIANRIFHNLASVILFGLYFTAPPYFFYGFCEFRAEFQCGRSLEVLLGRSINQVSPRANFTHYSANGHGSLQSYTLALQCCRIKPQEFRIF